MDRYLITPSLLNSYKWYVDSEYGNPEELRKEWLDKLRRVYGKTSEAAQKGIDFENNVEAYNENKYQLRILDENAKEKDLKYDDCVVDIANKVKDGYWQERLSKNITIKNNPFHPNGIDFILYGKSDVIKGDTIYDIKTTKNYEVGKFQDNPQHAIYCYCADIYKFKYLVTDFKSTYEEFYSLNEKGCLEYITSLTNDFIGYLQYDTESKELFFENWKSY